AEVKVGMPTHATGSPGGNSAQTPGFSTFCGGTIRTEMPSLYMPTSPIQERAERLPGAHAGTALLELHIRNFAIIDELHLNFHSGLNVLTGETGAGKSIIIDALGLLLGDRATEEIGRAHV